ncbi:hypothetical protein B0H14DRAFT_2559150 [Mycena olivaceomarginata]|nr:hypothetical protein B0H14DRAFT_2559150 [Mycena olivaceomarginata]
MNSPPTQTITRPLKLVPRIEVVWTGTRGPGKLRPLFGFWGLEVVVWHPVTFVWVLEASQSWPVRLPVRPADLVASHFCRAFLEAEKVSMWERRLGTQFGLHSEYGPHIDGKGILSFTTNVCATMAVHYIGETWFRFADAANAQQAVGMLAEEVWGGEIEEVEAEVQRTLEIARFLAGPVTQAVWPTMLLDPFFHLPNLRDEWDHLGSAHSLEVMSLTSMMQRSLLPNVLNNRARDMMLLLARLHPTEELDAVLELIEYVGGFRSVPL